jgi:ADP-ribosyl-[dinitrogen reductase] hydrolase
MTPTIPNIHDINALLEYLPYFQDQNNQFHQVIDKPPQLPYSDYSNTVDKFHHDLYQRNMIMDFNWPQWKNEGKKYFDNRELLDTADITIIQKLFTLIIRQDRFCEGLVGEMIDEGFILDLLLRLKDISSLKR